MKILVFLIMVLSYSTMAKTYSQNQKVSMEMEQASILDVLNEIREQTGLRFLYKKGVFDDFDRVDIEVEDEAVKELLDQLLRERGLECEIEEEVITFKEIVKPIPTKEAQEKKKIKGTITDDQGVPLPGVSVVIKGTNIGVATNIDGEYTLEFDQENVVLVFSFVGMNTREIAYTGQEVLNVSLGMDTEQMAEVVVTGYQTISKERATGSFSTLDEEAIDLKVTPTIVDKLKGAMPGLQVDKENNIIIRGQSTLFGNSKPLVVLDGFPTEVDLNDLNSDDIENVTVLKDASAASIWGTRAANGVIVITTKKSSAKKGVEVEASYYKTWSEKYDIDDLGLMNSREKVDFDLNVYSKFPDVVDRKMQYAGFEWSGQSPVFAAYTGKNVVNVPDNLKLTQEQYQSEIDRLRNSDGFGQFEKFILQHNQLDQYNVSLRSSNESNKFIGTISYNQEKGAYKGNENGRLNINLKNNLKLSDRINLDLGLNVIYKETKLGGIDRSYFYQHQPYEMIYDENGNKVQNYSKNIFFKSQYDEWGLDYGFNAIDELESVKNKTKNLTTRANFGLNFKINDMLDYSSKVQLERTSSEQRNYTSPNNYRLRTELNNNFIDGEYKNIPYGGRMDLKDAYTMSWTVRNQLNFTKAWDNERHRLSAIAGQEIRKYTSSCNGSSLLGYDPTTEKGQRFDELAVINKVVKNRYGSRIYLQDWSNSFSTDDNRDVSYYANASYLYNDILGFTGSYRLDQANIFGQNKSAKNNVLWSVGGSWNIKNHLLESQNFLNRLTLRATYGANGNRPSAAYTAYLTAEIISNSFHGPRDVQAASLTNPANPNLRSEKVYTQNLGVDYSMFNNRLRGSLEYYSRTSKDMIGPKLLNPAGGWSKQYLNYAEMNNKGVEILISGTPVKTNNFSWDVDFNFSYNKNEIQDVESTLTSTDAYVNVVMYDNLTYTRGQIVNGKPIGRIYAYNYSGVENGKLMFKDNKGEKYVATDAFNKDPKDVVKYMGTRVAPYFGSLTNTFNYKNFSLGFIINYKFGHKFYGPVNQGDISSYGYGDPVLSKKYFNLATNENPGGWIPFKNPLDWTIFYDEMMYAQSSDNIYDASWVKLTDINLSYKVPAKYLVWSKMKSATLKLQLKNVARWVANDLDIDPETMILSQNQRIINTRNFEKPLTIVAGVKVNF